MCVLYTSIHRVVMALFYQDLNRKNSSIGRNLNRAIHTAERKFRLSYIDSSIFYPPPNKIIQDSIDFLRYTSGTGFEMGITERMALSNLFVPVYMKIVNYRTIYR